MNERHSYFMKRAIALAEEGMNLNHGGPFGTVIVKDNVIIAEAYNRVTSTNDPTAHAEIIAIRKACENLNSYQLEGCTIYTSCEPCPMCLGAIYWARPKAVYYAGTREDAAKIEFDDHFIYAEFEKELHDRTIPFKNLLREDAKTVFRKWEEKEDKNSY